VHSLCVSDSLPTFHRLGPGAELAVTSTLLCLAGLECWPTTLLLGAC